jgi:hypothetical protein
LVNFAARCHRWLLDAAAAVVAAPPPPRCQSYMSFSINKRSWRPPRPADRELAAPIIAPTAHLTVGTTTLTADAVELILSECSPPALGAMRICGHSLLALVDATLRTPSFLQKHVRALNVCMWQPPRNLPNVLAPAIANAWAEASIPATLVPTLRASRPSEAVQSAILRFYSSEDGTMLRHSGWRFRFTSVGAAARCALCRELPLFEGGTTDDIGIMLQLSALVNMDVTGRQWIEQKVHKIYKMVRSSPSGNQPLPALSAYCPPADPAWHSRACSHNPLRRLLANPQQSRREALAQWCANPLAVAARTWTPFDLTCDCAGDPEVAEMLTARDDLPKDRNWLPTA